MSEYCLYVKYEVDILGVEAKNKKEAIKRVKDIFNEDHNISLKNKEIEVTMID